MKVTADQKQFLDDLAMMIYLIEHAPEVRVILEDLGKLYGEAAQAAKEVT
jgi:hypothetical protein